MSTFRTAILGFGRIAAGNADDPVMSAAFKYPCHASAIRDHPKYSLDAVVEPDRKRAQRAVEQWGVQRIFNSLDELAHDQEFSPDVIVDCRPPNNRHEVIELFPKLRGLIVEKPLALDLEEALKLSVACSDRGLPVQVNFWRRAATTFRALAAGGLRERIGDPQAVFGLYGNGIHNNGIHMVDFVEMLFGPVSAVQANSAPKQFQTDVGPLSGDVQFPFNLILESGLVVGFQTIQFEHYRENSLDIWGERARLVIGNDSRVILTHGVRPNRGLDDAREIAIDSPETFSNEFGTAFYEMYSNLADAIERQTPLFSPVNAAYERERLLELLIKSADSGGRIINL